MHYYEHHLGDHLRDTVHLTFIEEGALRRLLDRSYLDEAPLPTDLRSIYRLVRAISKPERAAVETVLREFFHQTPEGWRHNRCDREIAKYREKSGKAKASALARWNKPPSDGNANADANASADAMRTQSEGNATRARVPLPNNQKPRTSTNSIRFAGFWTGWPKNVRKASKGECLKLWQAKGLDAEAEEILAHVHAMAESADWTKDSGRFVPAPLTYLRQRRWDGAELGGINGHDSVDDLVRRGSAA